MGFSDEATAELRAITGHELVFGGEPRGEILFSQPPTDGALADPDLKWIQVTSAGFTRYDTDEFRSAMKAKGAQLTNSSSVFDEPCAQHALAFLLAFARQLPEAHREQLGPRDWSATKRRLDSRLLQEGRVLIVGYGAIGRRLVELLAPFGIEIQAVRRSPRGDEPVPTFGMDRLETLLPEADYVVNLLPANAASERLFDGAKFERMKEGALFLNIGRGTTVDQAGLLEALPRLGGAYLDVTDPEPLPREHPLWDAPNVVITPHTAGGHRGEDVRLVRHFLSNLRRFEAGEPLVDRVI
ncbi:D-2-hydroxyacid dehydrogenase [bacterium]|nr:MAG: D-2-hydroxyacid dehydrogenase [bacterium]